MIKLFVDHQGLLLEIPGVPAFRTPAEIDITKSDVNLIMSYLRQHGIHDYRIVSGVGVKEKVKTVNIVEGRNEDISKISKKLQKIENLLGQLLKREILIERADELPVKRRVVDEKDEEFIPSIDVSGLKASGEIFSKHGEIDDVSKNVELLSKVERGKK